MPSITDCAALSLDVYSRTDNAVAGAAGWNRLDAQNWQHGFAAGCYEKDGVRIVSFRGTEGDDFNDILSDVQMVPLINEPDAAQTLRSILAAYEAEGELSTSLITRGVSRLFGNNTFRMAVGHYANRTPRDQSSRAAGYVQQHNPAMVTGHSLGGALAKIVGLDHSVPCVAFNSPFMGDLRNVAPMTSGIQLSVNTLYDPLSRMTALAGNLSHGNTINVKIALPRQRPRRAPHPRILVIERLLGMSGRIVHAARVAYSSARHEAEVLNYLAEVMGHQHSMENLAHELLRHSRYGQALEF